MHEFQRVARAHREVFGRQVRDGDDDEDDDETTTRRTTTTSDAETTTRTTTTPATAGTTTSANTAATTTTSAARTTTTTSSAATTTTTPLINLSSVLGITSSTRVTTSSSTSSLPTTASSSTTSTSSATLTSSATSTSSTLTQERQLSTSTATRTASGTAGAASATESASNHSGLSGAATGGIIAGCVLVGLAVLIFAIRKTFMARRKRKRNTWGAGIYPDINDKFGDGLSDLPPPLPEKAPSSNGYLEPRTPVWAPPRPVSPNPTTTPSPPPPSSYYIQPPQASYNNAIMESAPGMAPVAVGGAAGSFGGQAPQGETAVVRVLYIPTLPDELSITTGEVVQVVKAYDDGWALCANARGEQGVVPLECLERSAQGQSDRLSVGNGQQESGGDWRNMKRMSSLSTQQQPHY
ncbi:hypothetical protein ACEPAF_4607 [Sanghuangporus sanghuang]